MRTATRNKMIFGVASGFATTSIGRCYEWPTPLFNKAA